MRLIMIATGPFAVPTFRALYQTPHAVAALVTAPPRVHRGEAVAPPSAARQIAEEHGTAIFDPEDVNAPASQAWLAEQAADLLVVCDYGQILKPATLAAARLGGINLHGSLLPKYRGAAPINWAIYHGETETGVSVIHVTPQIDAGPVIAQARLAIGPEETAAELEPRLAELGTRLISEAIDLLDSGRTNPLPQDPAQASKAPRLKKTDGLVDWSRPATAIKNQVRALEPWPKTYALWRHAGGQPLRLILGPVEAIVGPDPQAPSGTVVEAAAGRLVVAAGQGAVVIRSVQPAGKRMMAVEEFLRGHHVQPGERWGE
jgi:methionyl-tRNA formyltransferase